MLGGMDMTPLDRVLSYLQSRQEAAVAELMEFLRIPTISTDEAHQQDMRTAAAWLRDRLARAGFEVSRIEETNGGHPVVRARYRSREANPSRRRVVVYGHYDVQPVDPIAAWQYPPFGPEVIDGCLYARGAADDKGQLYLQLLAAEAWLKATGDIPVDLEFLFEGEEEIGSPHLPEYLESHVDELQADAAVISDTPMYADDLPAIVYGLRGLAALEVTVRGPQQDLHSGVYGGIVMNPAVVLTKLLGSLHDDQGRVQVPGFYDDVMPLDQFDQDVIAKLPFSEVDLMKSIHVSKLSGEKGYSTLERMWLRPTLDAVGMWGGFTSEGMKTVIPAHARAKLSCRLVPDQDPDEIQRLLVAHLEAQRPLGCRVRARAVAGVARPYSLPEGYPPLRLAASVLERALGGRTLFVRMGGTLPAAELFRRELGAETMFFSFSVSDEHYHAPGEFFRLARIEPGARAWFDLVGEIGGALRRAGSL